MTWEAYWYAAGCPRPRRLPASVTARKIAAAYAAGEAGYRSTGGDIWYLPADVACRAGWYHVGSERQWEALRLYRAATIEACGRHHGSATPEDVVAVLADPAWVST